MDDEQTPAAKPPPVLEALDLLGGLLPAPPPAQQPREQHQVPAAGLQSLQGGLASLYQQPQEQPPQGRFAALGAPAGLAGTWGSAPGVLAAPRPGGQYNAQPQPAAPHGTSGHAGGRAGAAMPQLPTKAYQPATSKLDCFGALDPFSAFNAFDQPRAIRQSA